MTPTQLYHLCVEKYGSHIVEFGIENYYIEFHEELFEQDQETIEIHLRCCLNSYQQMLASIEQSVLG